MPRLGPTTRAALIRGLHQLGFRGPSSGGKHQFMTKGHLRIRIPNPHRGDIGGHLLRAILREAGISVAEWENL
ncbi:MAG: type II toxin-antitoxin system HicA family toxin [Kofleriaceae bacterium]|nr:type II toxin-antitoxin system HicA family toxin [Candidatus Methylomirabilis lanthanidiphila]